MKPLFLSLVLLVSASSFAQKLEVGIDGGIGFNTAPNIISDADNNFATAGFARRHSDISPVAAAKIMLSYTKWQYGVEADYRQLSYLSSASSFYVLQANPSYNTVFISRKAIPFIAFVNRKITISHFEPYAGISVGYLLATQCDDPYALADVYYNHVVGNGVTGGVQAGATYFITNHLGINAEIKGDFMWLTLGAATYKLFDFPAMVGIRYKL